MNKVSWNEEFASWRITMVKVKCSVPNCQFETDDASEALVIAILANHGLAHQNSQPVSTSRPPWPETRATKSGHRRDNRRVERICSPLGRFPEWIRDRRGISPLPAFSMCRDRARRQPSKGQPKGCFWHPARVAGRHAVPSGHPDSHWGPAHWAAAATTGTWRAIPCFCSEGAWKSRDLRVYGGVRVWQRGWLY